MFSPEQSFLLGVVASVSGLLVGFMFISIGQLFKDKMLWSIGTAMALIAMSRGLMVAVGVELAPYIWSTIIICFRAVAVYLLIIGSLNGDIRYKETKFWLAAALAITGISSIYSNDTYIFMYTLAVSVGWAFAADRFWSRCGFLNKKALVWMEKDCDKLMCHPYCGLALLFVSRGVLTLVGGIGHESTDILAITYILGFITNAAMIPYVFRIGFCRHRIAMDCERTMIPVSKH